MATADLRDELTCSICLILYTNPVILPCGHNFCRGCIGAAWDSQGGSGAYSCPECRAEYPERPALPRNRTLGNIAARLIPIAPEPGESDILCTYCVHSPVPAAKSCLHCEASLCDTHLLGHSQSEKHILTAPTRSFGERKCPQHDELLNYYCHGEAVCVCLYCTGFGHHKGHNVEPLNEAFEKKKIQLKHVLEKLPIKREETEGQIQRLQERRGEGAEVAAAGTERVIALWKELEAVKKRLLSDISRQKEELSLTLTELIQQLEIKKENLSERMQHIEELCNMADPFSLLKKLESEGADIWNTDWLDNAAREGTYKKLCEARDLDEVMIMDILNRYIGGIVTSVKKGLGKEPIIMDTNTAHKQLTISGDGKSASYSQPNSNQSHSQNSQNYYPNMIYSQNYYSSMSHSNNSQNCQLYTQVLSSVSFRSGQHYWDVDCSKSGNWRVGVAYPSIERGGNKSLIGDNNKSWAVGKWGSSVTVTHDKNTIPISSCQLSKVRVFLDYEAGRLSFYELSEPIRRLHTFTAKFTEPLHAAFYLARGSVTITE
uniref:Tripartite motif containing 39 like gene 1 n=1 Tax=Xenopus tropicalis TaxID=8364 RepID=A0A803J3T6_XENTR